MGIGSHKVMDSQATVDDYLQKIGEILKDKFVVDPEQQMQKIPIKSLWSQHKGPTLIQFFRRWGCSLCRLGALELSETKTILDKKYGIGEIGFYGVGISLMGYEEFKEGRYFAGKLFIDEDRVIYKALGYKAGCLKNFTLLYEGGTLARFKKAKEKGIKHNFKGDGFQMGGTIIVTKKGEVLYHKPQKYYGDNPPEKEVLYEIKSYYKREKIEGKSTNN